MLEVSSPTAGSALIGPSQIEMLRAARELTVRTMSLHGESADSTPVNVPVKLPAIIEGASMPPCQSVPAHASVLTAGAINKEPSVCATSLSAAKKSTMPLSSIPDTNPPSPIKDVYANTPKAATNDAPLPTASYVEAWANPAVAARETRPLSGASANVQVSKRYKGKCVLHLYTLFYFNGFTFNRKLYLHQKLHPLLWQSQCPYP